jgi:ComF family protein
MGKAEAVQARLTVRALLDSLLAVVFAPPCAACGAPLDRPTEGPVCAGCWKAIPPMTTAFLVEGASMCRAAGAYAGSLSAIVHALKYQRRASLARPLAGLIERRCADGLAGADIVVPVPLHASRVRERGFNQAALLAASLSLPCVDALERIRATASQTDLTARERRTNVRGAFALRENAGRSIEGKCVVLVDDVATTGATLSECAKVLGRAGALDVRAVTAARAL